MRHNKLKKLVIFSLFLCLNTIPALAYAKNTEISDTTVKESVIKVEDNWLTEEVAKQLDKSVKDLQEQDFLNITKIDLKNKKINEKIPDEIKLLKNLEYLDLNSNSIDGTISNYLGELSKLKYLDLGNNKIQKMPQNIINNITNGNYEYCDVDGNKFKLDQGWYFLKGKWCYLDRNGNRVKGSQTIDGKVYEFDEEGNVKNGWKTSDDGNKVYYDGLNGIVKNTWKQIGYSWYYFDKDGNMQKGLQTINGAKYYLDENGQMVTGWQKIDNYYYYFSSSGSMQYGWLYLNDKTYYLDDVTGVMAASSININNKKYAFSSNGELLKNTWLDNYNYVNPYGEVQNTQYNYSHSNTNYQLFKYMTNTNNQRSVDETAVELHGGSTSNNCVYFTSEALRRIGVNIPTSTANTYQLEDLLENMGFAYSYDFSQIKPGDIVFTNNYTHVYIFMGWDKDGYAYIVDNQGTSFGDSVFHKRLVLQDTATTDRATHFFFYPY